MADNSDFKFIKEKRVDKETTLKISQSMMNGRVFVEFRSNNPRLVLQKNFQDNMDGWTESEKFSKSITSTAQLKEYFGLKKK